MSEIERVDAKDSAKNGALIGSAVGLYAGLMLAREPDIATGRRSGFGGAVFLGALGAAIYGSVGRWIDNKIEGRRTVYEKAGALSLVQIKPIVTRKSLGLGGSIGW